VSTYGPTDGSCTIRVFKAGLLSAMGHDMELIVTRWSLTVDDSRISGDFDGDSLEVRGALRDGELDPSRLSPKDRRDILDNIRKRVFPRHRPTQIHFECDDFDWDEDLIEGRGTLQIPPHSHDLDFQAELSEGRAICQLSLHQPDWGIVPFKAPLGVLKIKPDIQVRLDLPWS